MRNSVQEHAQPIDNFEASGTSPPRLAAANDPQYDREKSKTHVLPQAAANDAQYHARGLSPAKQAADKSVFADSKKKRTAGLWIVDNIIYTFVTNPLVFALSVGATYLTSYGHKFNAAGDWLNPRAAFGKFANAMARRGTKLDNFLMGFGMSKGAAENSRIVFFSFADGTLVAPLVKLLEDRREKFGKWIDDKLGTTPADLSVYEVEPKQNWRSVIGGRIATALIVAPTAIALNNVNVRIPHSWDKNLIRANIDPTDATAHTLLNNNKTNLNNYLFGFRGIVHGDRAFKKLQEKGWDNKVPKWLHLPEFLKVGYFELFYTSVCTGCLYVISRAFARHNDKKSGRVEQDPVSHKLVVRHKDGQAPNYQHQENAPEETPPSTTHQRRVTERAAEDKQHSAAILA